MPTISFDLFQDAVAPWQPDPIDWTAGWRRKLLAADGLSWPKTLTLGEPGGPGLLEFGRLDFAGAVRTGTPALTVEAIDDPLRGEVVVVTNQLAWNAIKSISVTEFGGGALVLQNFVDAFVDLGRATQGLAITLDGSKRGKVTTGAGDDRISVLADSNGRVGGNGFVIDSGAGDDEVSIEASTTDWSASFSAARYRAAWTDATVMLGDGDDRFSAGGSNDTVHGGAGNDRASLGGGTNLFDGGAGDDLLVLEEHFGVYAISRTADGAVFTRRDGTGTTTIRDVEAVWHDGLELTIDALFQPLVVQDDVMVIPNSDVTVLVNGVLANDTGAEPWLLDVSSPVYGTLEHSFGAWVYRANPGTGPVREVLTCTIIDLHGVTATSTLVIEIGMYDPPPRPQADAAVLGPGGSVTVAVLANDEDDGPLAVTSVGPAAAGRVQINPDGTITYTAGPAPLPTDRFTYTVTDAAGQEATATVTVSLPPAPRAGFTVGGDAPLGQPVPLADQNGDGVADLAFLVGDTVHVVFADPPAGAVSFEMLELGIGGYVVSGIATGAGGVPLAAALGGDLAVAAFETVLPQDPGQPIAHVVFGGDHGAPQRLQDITDGLGGGYVVARPDGQMLQGLAAAGDLTGDGREDLVLLTTTGVHETAASLWLVPGQDGTETAVPELLATLPAIPGVDLLGLGMALSAGDANGDGVAELLVGRASRDFQLTDDGGLLGWTNETRFDLLETRGTDAPVPLVEKAILGFVDAGVADVSGDGVADLLTDGVFDPETGVTDPGVWLGEVPGAGYRLNGDGRFGLAAVGDVNGDGVADLAHTEGSNPIPWGARIVFGLANDAVAALPWDARPSTGFEIGGDDPVGFTGAQIIGVGDQNGDGLDDLLVGAPSHGATGAAFLVFGQGDEAPVLASDLLAGIGGVAFAGTQAGMGFGGIVEALPDMNGDGRAELYMGSTQPGFGLGQVVYSNPDWLA